MLENYQREFIEFAIGKNVLQFGDFELKSGRRSPYFFNAGLFNTGGALLKLGSYYAEALVGSGKTFDMLIGPAYKGIPLVSATAMALAMEHGLDVPYVFNRKEAKRHGEGGDLVGAPLNGRVVIVDDIITAGTAIREIIQLLKAYQTAPEGIIVAIDRQERGTGELSAIEEVEQEFGLFVISVVNLEDIIEYLELTQSYEMELVKIREYHHQYGVIS